MIINTNKIEKGNGEYGTIVSEKNFVKNRVKTILRQLRTPSDANSMKFTLLSPGN